MALLSRRFPAKMKLGGVRIEKEVLGSGQTAVHNYGAGVTGY